MSLAGAHEDARLRKRDRASVVTGAGVGAALGALLGVLGSPAVVLCAAIGAALGAVVGRVVGTRVSPDDWDPPAGGHSYVGANTPDDDIVGS